MPLYGEPVSSSNLEEGRVYFSVTFLDGRMSIPQVEPLVFIGRNLSDGDVGQVYFQDFDSHRRGVRYKVDGDGSPALFLVGSENEVKHISEYEAALDRLLVCSLRRKKG